MRFSLAASTALLAVAQARIYGIAVPQTIKPGDTINAIILTENYIQSVYDVAAAFGYDVGAGHQDSLGRVVGSFYLGPTESNVIHNLTKSITIPTDASKGKGLITASVMSLWGAAYWPQVTNYNVTVTFGGTTSKNYVSSNPY